MNNGESPQEEEESGESTGPSWWKRLTHRLAGAPSSREDLIELLDGAQADGIVDADAAAMIRGVFETAELQARDIMIPRAQMIVLERGWNARELLKAVVESGHSRFPVIGDSRDEVLGILLAKDLLKFTGERAPGDAGFDLGKALRPAVFVPDARRVNMLLKDFRKSRNHMAIVVDEYGGVAGLLTIEDVLEQIVGEIDDEHDEAEIAHILKQSEQQFLVAGLTPIAEFNEHFGVEFPEEEFDTIGGLVMNRFARMPRRGESMRIGHFKFIVQRTDNRRILLLQALLQPP